METAGTSRPLTGKITFNRTGEGASQPAKSYSTKSGAYTSSMVPAPACNLCQAKRWHRLVGLAWRAGGTGFTGLTWGRALACLLKENREDIGIPLGRHRCFHRIEMQYTTRRHRHRHAVQQRHAAESSTASRVSR